MSWLIASFIYIVPFLVVLTVLVFVHEFGHYWSARRNGVKIQVFSIGFGPELFGYTDRAGTRWKVSVIPLGGYVKMFGDADAMSTPGENLVRMSPAEQAVSFHHKRLSQRAEIVAAGPIANFLFSIIVFAGIFMTVGERFTPTDIDDITPGSAAEQAGLQPHDVIVGVDGHTVDSFEDLRELVAANTGTPMQIEIRRAGQDLTLTVTPTIKPEVDIFGTTHQIGMIGVVHTGPTAYVKRNPVSAVGRAVAETWNLSTGTLGAVWQMVIGIRTTDELGGPLSIAHMSGKVAENGPVPFILFMAFLSINLGLINLFPIPILDGGHLLFYAAEAIRGKPLGPRAQEYGFRVGLALVMTLMVFATWNDLVHVGVIKFLKGLVT